MQHVELYVNMFSREREREREVIEHSIKVYNSYLEDPDISSDILQYYYYYHHKTHQLLNKQTSTCMLLTRDES